MPNTPHLDRKVPSAALAMFELGAVSIDTAKSVLAKGMPSAEIIARLRAHKLAKTVTVGTQPASKRKVSYLTPEGVQRALETKAAP